MDSIREGLGPVGPDAPPLYLLLEIVATPLQGGGENFRLASLAICHPLTKTLKPPLHFCTMNINIIRVKKYVVCGFLKIENVSKDYDVR